MNSARVLENTINFLGQVSFATGTLDPTGQTQIGGLSGITYNRATGVYYAISDDSNLGRFYQLNINLSDGRLDNGDIQFTNVTTLKDAIGNPLAAGSLDPEGIAIAPNGELFISSEGNTSGFDPFIKKFSLTGNESSQIGLPNKFLPTPDRTRGIRPNLAFESLTLSPNGRFLYTATEDTLVQDGPQADRNRGGLSRIIKYDLLTGAAIGEFVYRSDPKTPTLINDPSGRLVELLALDDNGTLLALERSPGLLGGFNVKLYEVRTQGATDVRAFDSLQNQTYQEVSKKLLFDFSNLNISLDNIEGMTFGPKLPSGQQSLILVSDNNFNSLQKTQFIVLGLDIQTTPIIPQTDFNGDGKSDILWRNRVSGENALWLMNGTAFGTSVLLNSVADSNWQIISSGDFNGDGKSDILWRNSLSGENAAWLMNGTAFSTSVWLNPVADSNWKAIGTGDFNGDGKSDILWRNSLSGENALWLMNGTAFSTSVWLNPVADSNWKAIGTGDFNGDGKSDILWRNSLSGENATWLMNGTAFSTSVLFPPAAPNWEMFV